ncbi:lysophospholipase [Rothia terrae]|uniref:Lysophospholipase n=1 Tax=Rothia terrae TaxID=396015 RepID=A0A7H2BFT2_9MICC|nr:GDSL-type esterase/lipase family protein [Rothia terrae]MDT0189086.1 GDSL-type esterase/lipase family protein [Rothia terrae]NKZ33281.1 lysophospholipase [Rothia terrae]QNV38528.1 lysophospholipase [Rothia terrae]
MDQRNIRIVAVGDELLSGVGDPRALGWFGRVMARTPQNIASVAAYNLAAPGEGSELLNSRWFEEAARRFSQGADNRLVIAPSTLDVDLDITSARSRLNLANMVDMASQNNVKVLVVGPPPTLDAERNRRIADLSAAYADVVTRRNHVYVDTFNPLLHHEQWRNDLAANDGRPGQSGYGLMAWLVLHRGWYSWLNLPEPV